MLSVLTYEGQRRQLRAGQGVTLAEVYLLPCGNYFEAVAPPRFPYDGALSLCFSPPLYP